jgi:hypothetical protein
MSSPFLLPPTNSAMEQGNDAASRSIAGSSLPVTGEEGPSLEKKEPHRRSSRWGQADSSEHAGDLRRRTSRCAGGRQRAARQGGSAVEEASAAGGAGPPWTKASASGPSSSEMDGEEPRRRREGLRRRGGVRRHGGGGPTAAGVQPAMGMCAGEPRSRASELERRDAEREA